ncbi:MAG: hypothetical protein AAGF12_04230 [Myxococcota bacterium]
MAPAPISAVFYAINGTGLGHLSRLLHIARATREILAALGREADFRFVTTSEASDLARDFPVYKIPSKTRLRALGGDQTERIGSTKLFVTNLIGSLHPDVLILDTSPMGSFNEFAFLRSYARSTVFVDRHKDRAVQASPVHAQHLRLYDRILIPDHEAAKPRYRIDDEVALRTTFVGPIHGFDSTSAWSREAVRAHFDVKDDERLVYLSAGGGGDANASAELERWIEAFSLHEKTRLLVGYGPLYPGEKIYRRNMIALTEPGVARYFRGVDAAVSAAGYNSYQELLAAEVPTLFFAQEKGMDRQDERVAIGANAGFHLGLRDRFGTEFLPDADPAELAEAAEALFDSEVRSCLQENLRTRDARSGATRAAREILSLLATRSGLGLASADVDEACRWRASFDAPRFVEAARAYRRFRRYAADPGAIALEQAREPNPEAPISVGAELDAARLEAGLGDEAWARVLRAAAKYECPSDVRRRARDLASILRTLGTAHGLLSGFVAKIREPDLFSALARVAELSRGAEERSAATLLTEVAKSERLLNLRDLSKLLPA